MHNVRTRCLLDTGSFYSLVSIQTARRLKLKIQQLTSETRQSLFSANGTSLKLLGTADVTLDISHLKIPHTVYVCENLNE